MRNKVRFIGCIVVGIFFWLQVNSSAQEPASPRPEAREETPVPSKAFSEKARYQKTPKVRGYTYNLKRLLITMEEKVKTIDEEIKERAVRGRNEEREARVIECFERANALYEKGRLQEAKKEMQKALKVSRDPEMKRYIKESEKRLKEQECARKKEEHEKQKRVKAAQKEKERQLNDQAKIFYDQASILYGDRNYEQAQVKFEQASRIVPHYLKTDYYLRLIPKDIQRETERIEKKRQIEIAEKQKKSERIEKQRQKKLEQQRKAEARAEKKRQE
ncbi:MAG: tetratricopeptide repeat protein, partial [Candidatus Omnitrophica bacterium]|nr:tetratricopeptide repeat protein [Candidatus Omnitrophota bacterium]